MGDHSGFFYGTLMARQVFNRVCYGDPKPPSEKGKHLDFRPAVLHDHCRHKVRRADFPAILPEKGAAVRGSFVSGLTDNDIWRIDIFEGSMYERRKVKVKLLDQVGNAKGEGNVEGEEVEGETYIWIDPIESLEKGEWDFEVFQKEKMGRWIGEDTEYEEVDEAVAERHGKEDPTGGRGAGGHISNQLEEAKTAAV